MADPFRQMLEDLSQIAEIPTERLQALGDTLEYCKRPLTASIFVKLVAKAVPDDTQGLAVYSTLNSLSADVVPELLESIDQWRNSSEANRFSFPDERFSALQEKLPILIRDYPTLNRMRKARQLATILGNRVEDFDFICDARPVYNDERTEIEGIVPVTTLKVTYERQTGAMEEVELVFTEDALSDFIEAAQLSQQKLQVLRTKAENWFNIDSTAEAE